MSRQNRSNNETTKKQLPIVIVPSSKVAEQVQNELVSCVKIVTAGGRKVGEMVKRKVSKEKNLNSVVYKVEFGGCSRVYYGETGRGLATRVREHRADVRYHRTSSAFVAHVDEAGHLPDWTTATSLETGLTKSQRRIVEAAFIGEGNVLNTSPGFFRLASSAAKLIRSQHSTISR